MVKQFSANGKLLLTGEYFVLDGALALAVPTKLGQKMRIRYSDQQQEYFLWESYDADETKWFSGQYRFSDLSCLDEKVSPIATRLSEILQTARSLHPDFLTQPDDFHITKISTHLDFPRNWGLGTSSTLIAMIAEWANINPYQLLAQTFGGSGYDLACATADQAILYQLPKPEITPVDFNPNFADQLYFVYLNQKQNSREGIAQYRKLGNQVLTQIDEISQLTQAILSTKSRRDFEQLINKHEDIVSKTLNIPTVKSLYFSNFEGSVKSLGAWGGDFVLATSDWTDREVRGYFKEKGFEVVLGFKELV